MKTKLNKTLESLDELKLCLDTFKHYCILSFLIKVNCFKCICVICESSLKQKHFQLTLLFQDKIDTGTNRRLPALAVL